MISKLPLEIQVQLLKSEPSSSLKYCNSHFYLLYNSLFYSKIISTFGEDILKVLFRVLPWLKKYIRSLDVFRYNSRNAISSRLKLENKDTSNEEWDDSLVLSDNRNPFKCMYVEDSWKYICSLLKNKRLFAEYSDYQIDEPSNYVYNHYVEINRTYLLSYKKTLWLAPGTYNLNIGLIIKHGSGLGTTKFEIRSKDHKGKDILQTFYPPSNINEILPKKQFCLLKLGEFQISPIECNDDRQTNKMQKVELVMEEIGLYLKSGFRIFFIDVAQPSALFNDYDLLYYTFQETDYRHFINIPLKDFYKALNAIQNTDVEESNKIDIVTPPSNLEYEECLLNSNFNIDNPLKQEGYEVDIVMKYAEFYYINNIRSRYYKFNTIYQRRQFINRFGNFELDWEQDQLQFENNSHEDSFNRRPRRCNYDKYGMRWKIPILGEL